MYVFPECKQKGPQAGVLCSALSPSLYLTISLSIQLCKNQFSIANHFWELIITKLHDGVIPIPLPTVPSIRFYSKPQTLPISPSITLIRPHWETLKGKVNQRNNERIRE